MAPESSKTKNQAPLPTARMVGQNIAFYRKKAGHTLRSLAEDMTRNGHPMSHSVISQMEKGARRIDVDELVVLATFTDTSAAALLTPRIFDEDGTFRDVAPQDIIGDSFHPNATAIEVIARNFRLPPNLPEWIEDAIGTHSGLRWRYQYRALQTVDKLRTPMGTEDIDMLLTIANGLITREQQQHETEDPEDNDG
ncbi:helix-turn-helix transcriptional regulator [Corynebacterium sp.]|uniref:helix-turn-helix domain-containing protein n=1 Tax=Corynebacterium sp. TaxID=1720 RepID=UPI0025C18B42|nr:helix-turn-helix transcriptional regulator [Corynebacterium sp.]